MCPQCLVEREGAWRLSWKLPWVFACQRHGLLLLERCPDCGGSHGHGTGDSCLPPFAGRVPKLLRCSNRPDTNQRRPTTNRGPCGARLDELDALDLSATATLPAQAGFESVIAAGSGIVAGEHVTATEYFREARSLYALLFHHGRTDDFPSLPSSLVEGVAAFFARRDKTRAGDAGATRKRHVVMYRRTLTDVAVMAALAPTIAATLQTSSGPELSEALHELARRIYQRHSGRLGLRQCYGVSARLEAALLTAMPRRRSRVWVKNELHRLAEIPSADLATFARRLPQMLWPDAWRRYFAGLIATRADWQARRFLSMLLVKLATQCSWGAAFAALGYRGRAEAVAVGYINRASREGTTEQLRAAADQVLAALAGSPAHDKTVDYGHRRAAFVDLVRIDEVSWERILARADARDTRKRRYSAATWLWSELTGGYPPDAPGWADTPPRVHEMYRQFLKSDLAMLRPALLDHGRSLLVAARDAHPERVELKLH